MVDCGAVRCMQERRSFKKELLSWSKKVPIIVGLELVAAELLGRRSIRTLLLPFNDLETEAEDWAPPSSGCTFCKRPKTPLTDDSEDEDEEEEFGPLEVSPAVNSPGLRYLSQVAARAFPASSSLAQNAAATVSIEDVKPLDLSASAISKQGSCHDDDDMTNFAKSGVELKVPQIFSKGKKKDGYKRTYTEDDLSLALSDIRSGKLGTRRAAVLYGIPRSTLRNKMYKLDCEDSMSSYAFRMAAQENKLSMGDLLQGGAAAFPYGFPFPFRDEKLSPLSEMDWEQKLEQLRRKHNLMEPNRKFGVAPMFDLEAAYDEMAENGWGMMMTPPFMNKLKYPFLPELVRRMAEERLELEQQQHLQQEELDLRLPKAAHTNGNPSLTPPVELKIPSYKPIMSAYANGNGATHPPLAHSPPSHHSSSMLKISETLKDIIAKTIAEKVRSRGAQFQNDCGPNTCSPLVLPQNLHNGNLPQNGYGEPPNKRARVPSEPIKEEKSTASAGETSDSGKSDNTQSDKAPAPVKKTRPKRGQYRKYNSQLLLEAVRAVQRGEMSVHRAGSYFGVPHSTLEYKVKERHLLRQRKPRENRKKVSEGGSSTSTSPVTSTSSASLMPPVTSAILTPPMVSSQPSAMSTMAALAHHSTLAASMGFPSPFSLGLAWSQPGSILPGLPTPPELSAFPPPPFPMNTSASELLRKLQRKVEAGKSTYLDEDDDEMSSISAAHGNIMTSLAGNIRNPVSPLQRNLLSPVSSSHRNNMSPGPDQRNSMSPISMSQRNTGSPILSQQVSVSPDPSCHMNSLSPMSDGQSNAMSPFFGSQSNSVSPSLNHQGSSGSPTPTSPQNVAPPSPDIHNADYNICGDSNTEMPQVSAQ